MKRMLLITASIFILGPELCLSQDVNLPVIIPPSPAAQAIVRYGEIPVDYSTGVPNISIPIYTVQGKKLTLPISISYHASGIKVGDISSEVGLGWALNCGGMVARTILGRPDEYAAMPRTFNTAQQLLDSVRTAVPILGSGTLYANLMNLDAFFSSNFEAMDPMSDRFFYSLPTGASGVFRYDYLNFTNLITLPYRPLKIEGITRGHSIDSVKITDDNGIAYLFRPFTNYPAGYTEWYLTKMVSADGTDSIKLAYTAQTANQAAASEAYSLISDTVDIDNNCSLQAGVRQDYISGYQGSTTTFNTPVLSSITCSNATINFSYYKDRSDFNVLYRLSDITVIPLNASSAIRSVHFSQSNFGSGSSSYRLRLDSVTISAPVDGHPQKYSFTYESQMLPPYPYKDASGLRSEDFWGYYNAANSPNLVPANFSTRPQDQLMGGNRDPDNGLFSKACMISAIKYPTGGRTVFHFGRNYAQGVYPYKTNHDGYVGGFRIDSLTNYNENNQVVGLRSYLYAGAKARPITRELFWNNVYQGLRMGSTSSVNCIVCSWDERVESESYLPLDAATGLPVMYTEVTEFNGTPTNNTGKMIYEYSMPYLASDFDANPEHPLQWELPVFYHPFQYDKGNYVPELLSQTAYSFDGTSYHPLSRTVNTYSKLFTQEFQTGIKLTRTLNLLANFQVEVITAYANTVSINQDVGDMPQRYINSVAAIDAKAYQEASLVTNSKKYTFNPADSTKYILTSTDYTYNSSNLAILEKTTNSSKGDLLKTAYKYPLDVTGAVYSSMTASHILAPVIAQTDSINATFLQTVTTNYKDWGNNVLAPETVTRYKNSVADTLIRYKYNTLGNLVETSKNKDAVTCYLWGYNRQYPVAKISGSNYSTVSGVVTQAQIDAATGITANDAGVRTLLNGLRTGLPGALVNTYTYAPAVGMTSQTNPAGFTNYFVYDGAGRLKLMLDKDQNIVKKYGYEYAGQAESYGDTYYVGTRSGAFIRNNCGAGITGSTVTYSATANSAVSQADADAKAQADVDANGQNYANTYGLCVPSVTVTASNTASSFCYGVEFYSSSNGVDIFFDISSGNSTLGTVPAGTYDYVAFYTESGGCGTHSAQVVSGSHYYNAGTIDAAYFTNVSISGSCYITIQ